ncbi:MAG: diguanylate cyclase domain-containing protein [Coriobacteriales bacterium]
MFTVFNAAVALFSVALLLFSLFAFFSKIKWSNLLGGSCLAGLVVLTSYSASLLSSSFFAMSAFTSIYFAAIDVMLLTLLVYLAGSKGIGFEGRKRFALAAFIAVGVLDCVSLLLNPFTGHAMIYELQLVQGSPYWEYVPLLPYYMHLAFDYVLIACSIAILVYRTVMSPRVYHARYIPIIVMIALIVLVNALFLYFPIEVLDLSVLLYPFCAGFICINDFMLQERMLRQRVGNQVLDSLNQPIVFFDNEGLLCFSNADAEFMFSGVQDGSTYTLGDFVENCGLARDVQLDKLLDDRSFRWAVRGGGAQKQYRCDFKVLRDAKDRVMGYLFVFIDISLAVDTLTGFQNKVALKNNEPRLSAELSYPACVCLLDLNRLAELNTVVGRDRGDEAVRSLALVMREIFPAGSEFARMDDATLLAICSNMGQRQAHELCSDVEAIMGRLDYGTGSLKIQSAVAELCDEETDIVTALSLAQRSLFVQKMLNPDSAHSSLLDSLEQTLKESDPGTEAHVRRTSMLAAKLGERLELSDYDQSSLALLCLLHDIGKLGIPLEILNKPGKLTDEEWDLMRSHVEKGYRIAMASDELREIAPCILHHHESWDGSGYPDGLRAEAIPLLSRIVAVVDTYDAMVNDRPYRSALGVGAARAELQRCAGAQFDPYIVKQFLAVLDDLGYVGEDCQEQQPAVATLPRSFTQAEYQEGAEKGLAAVEYVEYVLDENDYIIEIGDDFTRLTGYTREDLEALHPRQIDLIFPEDAELYFSLVAKQLEKGPEALMEHRIRRKDGSERNVICLGRRYFDSVTHEQRVNVTVVDTAHSATVNMLLKREQERARRSVDFWERGARADSLTGVLNHQAFVNAVQERAALETCRVMLCVIDLDNFKLYNDRYGHPRGDELLLAMAEALSRAVPANSLVGRLGGDEFAAAVFYAPGSLDEDAAQDATQLWSRVMRSINSGERPCAITMGAALGEPDSFDFNLMYDYADALLYEAKEAGRSRVNFESAKLSICRDLHGNQESLSFE